MKISFHIFSIATKYLVIHLLQYQKYLWWKQHLTTLQMIQFVLIMVHGFQLVFYDDCDFPWQFAYYIGAHAILFFILFSEFYVKNYLLVKKSKKVRRWKILVKHLIWLHDMLQKITFYSSSIWFLLLFLGSRRKWKHPSKWNPFQIRVNDCHCQSDFPLGFLFKAELFFF